MQFWVLTSLYNISRSMHFPALRAVRRAHTSSAHVALLAVPNAVCQREWAVGSALIGREPESHLHLGQAALALNPRAPPSLPPSLATAAALVALDTRVHQLAHTYCTLVYKVMQSHVMRTQVFNKENTQTHGHLQRRKHTGVNFMMS